MCGQYIVFMITFILLLQTTLSNIQKCFRRWNHKPYFFNNIIETNIPLFVYDILCSRPNTAVDAGRVYCNDIQPLSIAAFYICDDWTCQICTYIEIYAKLKLTMPEEQERSSKNTRMTTFRRKSTCQKRCRFGASKPVVSRHYQPCLIRHSNLILIFWTSWYIILLMKFKNLPRFIGDNMRWPAKLQHVTECRCIPVTFHHLQFIYTSLTRLNGRQRQDTVKFRSSTKNFTDKFMIICEWIILMNFTFKLYCGWRK